MVHIDWESSNKKLLNAVKEYAENNSMIYIKVEEYDKLIKDAELLKALSGIAKKTPLLAAGMNW
jgi:predicted transcriptional regulator